MIFHTVRRRCPCSAIGVAARPTYVQNAVLRPARPYFGMLRLPTSASRSGGALHDQDPGERIRAYRHQPTLKHGLRWRIHGYTYRLVLHGALQVRRRPGVLYSAYMRVVLSCSPRAKTPTTHEPPSHSTHVWRTHYVVTQPSRRLEHGRAGVQHASLVPRVRAAFSSLSPRCQNANAT